MFANMAIWQATRVTSSEKNLPLQKDQPSMRTKQRIRSNYRLRRLPLKLCKALKVRFNKWRTATGMDGTLHTDFRKSENSRDNKKSF